MNNPNKSNAFQISDNFQFFILFSLSLGIIYSPCLLIPYAYHDDFLYLPIPPNELLEHPQYQVSLAIGRVITAILINCLRYFVHSLPDLLLIRFFTLIQLILTGIIVYQFAKRLFHNSLFGYLTTLCLMTLPAFSIIIGWASLTTLATALLLASMAFLFADQVSTSMLLKDRFLNHNSIICLIFLFLSLITYPAASGFYWAISFLGIVVAAQESFVLMKQKTLNYFFPALFSYSLLAIYYLSIKSSAINFTSRNLDKNSIYNLYSITNNIPEKIIWFFKEPLHQSLNFWNIFPSNQITVFSCIILIMLLTLWLSGILRKTITGTTGTTQTATWLILTFLICLTFSFLPNLVTKENIAFYRCCTGLSTLILIAFLAITKIVSQTINAKIKNILIATMLLSLAMLGAASAHQNIFKYRVLPSYFEFKYLKSHLLQAMKFNRNHIHITQIDKIPYPYRYDEFGTLTEAFPQDLAITISSAYHELFAEGKYIVHQSSVSRQKDELIFVFILSAKTSPPFVFKTIVSASFAKLQNISHEAYVIDKTKNNFFDIIK